MRTRGGGGGGGGGDVGFPPGEGERSAPLRHPGRGARASRGGLQTPTGESQCVPCPAAQMLTTRAGFPGPGLRSQPCYLATRSGKPTLTR